MMPLFDKIIRKLFRNEELFINQIIFISFAHTKYSLHNNILDEINSILLDAFKKFK